tara:strand:- start:1213 stop:2520 length:1308 start_codon:yes stop_codon:yes gene_type:complete
MGRRRGRRRNRRRSRRGPSRSRRNTRRTTRRTRTRTRTRRAAPKRRNTRTSQRTRAANRAASRAQRAAKKRVAARKAAGRKPSGAKSRSQARASARARAQAAAKKRIARGRTISQTKAANQKRMRDAAAARNKAFRQKRAAEAKARQQKSEAKRKADATAAKRRQETSRKAAVDRARKAAEARKAAAAKKPNIGPVADGAAYARNIVRSRFPGASSNSRVFDMTAKQLNQTGGPFAQPGAGPTNDPDYKTAYAPNTGLNNLIRTNPITDFARDAAYSLGFNTPRLFAQDAEAMQDKRDQRSQFHVGNKARLTSTNVGRGKGSNQAMQIQPEIEEELPVENTTVEEANPLADLTNIQQDAYNTALQNYNAGTGYSGQGEGTGFGNLSQEVIAALMAGNRGQKRFRYGTARKRGSDSLLTRGSERFKGFTTTGQLNI